MPEEVQEHFMASKETLKDLRESYVQERASVPYPRSISRQYLSKLRTVDDSQVAELENLHLILALIVAGNNETAQTIRLSCLVKLEGTKV